jgi:nitronate monooxygenase
VVLDELSVPVVLAPLGGGASTPALTATVCEAGGFGFLALGYLDATAAAERIEGVRNLTQRPFGVNVFSPVAGPADPASYREYAQRVAGWARERGYGAGTPRYTDDDFRAKLELLVANPVAVVSFAFGCPAAATVERLQAAGSEVWVTVTSPPEADEAQAAGADALIAQGIEAGGHRGSFTDDETTPAFGLLSLLQLIAARQDVPIVASGGIATGAAVAAVLCAGAQAAALGTAFMLCPEAGTPAAHREALRSKRTTALTRAFTGRTARGIRNELMDEHHEAAPFAYPEVHYLTAPIRAAGRAAGDDTVINLWAGEAHSLAREIPAGELVHELAREAQTAMGRLDSI